MAQQKRAYNGNGTIGFGSFVDAGNASYGTYNYVYDSIVEESYHIRGGGDINYLGGGAFLRREWNNGFRLDAMFRGGNVENKFFSSDMSVLIAENVPVSYRMSNAYWGATIGLNYTEQIGRRSTFDVFGKYSWTTVEGGRVKLSTTEIVDFEALDSLRLIAGGRWTVRRNSALSGYVGAAYEHELAGVSRAVERETGMNHVVGNSSIAGSTGVGEVGVIMRPSERFQLTSGLEGYTGKRNGGSAFVAAVMKW